MKNIKIDLKNTNVTDKEIVKYAEEVKRIHEDLLKRAGNKKDFVGWLELPNNYDKKEFDKKLCNTRYRGFYFLLNYIW